MYSGIPRLGFPNSNWIDKKQRTISTKVGVLLQPPFSTEEKATVRKIKKVQNLISSGT
jgi:hypothetical protein